METRRDITAIRLHKVLMLAGTACLLLLPAADSQKPEELTEHLHMTWVANWEVHNSDVYSKSDSSDHITVELDATAHATAPGGTPPWQMDPTITAFHYAVSGNGSLAMTQKHEWAKGSWTWGLAEAPKDPSQIATLDNGSFSFTPFGLDELKIEPQGQVESGGEGVPTQSVPAANAATGVLAALPLVYAHVSVKSFYDQLSGTFDPNTKAFTKTGKASGSYSGSWSDGSLTGSVDAEYSLNFNQQPEDVEAILIPQKGYEQWMPQAGHDEDTPGNGLLVNVELQKKDKPGQKPHAKAKSFKFELTGVSKEPGVCMNWPPKGKTKKDPDFDLKIDKEGNPSLQVAPNGQSATSGPDLQDSSVIVFSYDWGAWGSLKVTAELDNGQTVTAHLQNKPDITLLKIPKDDNENRIADEWEKQFKDKTPESDDDKLEYQELTQGDGLSLYEEYRGFMVGGGSHIRTDPNVPDVFIFDQDDLGTANLDFSGLAIHTVELSEVFMEIDPDPSVRNWWIINFNSHNANLGKQHAIWLQDADPGTGLAGIDIGGPGPPKTSQVVKVGIDAIKRAGHDVPYMLNTISHELAHGANVWHHGDNDYSVRQIWKLAANGTWAEVPPPRGCQLQKPTDTCYDVAAQGGQESGVQNCIMRYEQSYLYEWDKGPYRWIKGSGFQRGDMYGDAQPSGTRYCRAVNGTGVNGRGYIPVPIAGDATNGNCAAQFCTNDIKRCWFKPTYAKR